MSQPRDVRGLQGQQCALALQPPGVADDRAVRADHAVTGHDDGEGVAPVRQAHRPRRIGLPQLPGQCAVGDRRAVGDGAQGVPDARLERRPYGGQRQVEGGPRAAEVFAELPAGLGEGCRGVVPHPARAWGRAAPVLVHVQAGQGGPVGQQQQRPDGAAGMGVEVGVVSRLSHASRIPGGGGNLTPPRAPPCLVPRRPSPC